MEVSLISGTSRDQREALLNEWAREQLTARSVVVSQDGFLVPASDDASFRRYYRFKDQNENRMEGTDQSFIFVDAPPEKEDSKPFVTVSENLIDAGLNAPIVHAVDYQLGFMMQSDLGTNLYLSSMKADGDCADRLYKDAVDALCTMQAIRSDIPDYDIALLQMEMDLFPDWFLLQELGLEISAEERELLDDVFRMMVDNALQQPRVFVHRDYHSRNLMVTDECNPGIIDFQDAVSGPVTYDLVSLLRDCYYQLPGEEVSRWVDYFRVLLMGKRQIDPVDENTFRRWFDLMGLQRHLKCAGIFSRLHLRDGKPGYLGDIPLIIRYIREVCAEYDELHSFNKWLCENVEPRLESGMFKR